MKKIVVSKEKCIGCGACVAIDPEHFEFNDEGKSTPIMNENLESANLMNAIESCPTSAISITDGDEGCACDEACECDNQNCSCEPCTCEHCDCND